MTAVSAGGGILRNTRERARFLTKSLVKRAVRRAGYEMHPVGALAIGRTMGRALEHLRDQGFRPSTVIDVGVGDGTPDLYRCFPHARFLLIEPLREFESAISRIQSQVRAEHVLAAAADSTGTAVMRVHGNMLASSTLPEADSSDESVERREVPRVTIDSLMEERDLFAPMLIKIDVQSGELAALRGADRTLQSTEVVITEVPLFQSHLGGPQFFDVLEWMQQQGFVVYDIFGGSLRPHDGALAQVDIVFVKEHGRFRKHHGFR